MEYVLARHTEPEQFMGAGCAVFRPVHDAHWAVYNAIRIFTTTVEKDKKSRFTRPFRLVSRVRHQNSQPVELRYNLRTSGESYRTTKADTTSFSTAQSSDLTAF